MKILKLNQIIVQNKCGIFLIGFLMIIIGSCTGMHKMPFIDEPDIYISSLETKNGKGASIIESSQNSWEDYSFYSQVKKTVEAIIENENIVFMLRIEMGYIGEGGYNCYWLLYTGKNGYFIKIINPNIVKKMIISDEKLLTEIKKTIYANKIFELKSETSNADLFDPSVFFISIFDDGKINQFAIISPILGISSHSYDWERKIFKETENYSNIINAMFEISRNIE